MSKLEFAVTAFREAGSEVGALLRGATSKVSHAAKWTGARVSRVAEKSPHVMEPGGMNGLQFAVQTLKEAGSTAGSVVGDLLKGTASGISETTKLTVRGVAGAAKWTGNRVSDVAAWSVGGVASNVKQAISSTEQAITGAKVKKPFGIATAGMISAASVAAVGVAANHSHGEAAEEPADGRIKGEWASRVAAAEDLGSATPSQPAR
ncbi:MAG: hypothetical protein ACK502_08415 [Alphaproteobacteria bacterium]